MAALKSARPRLVENFDSPAHAELGLAIAARNTLVAELDTLSANFDIFETACWRASEAEEAAEKAVTDAADASARHTIAVLHNPDAPRPMTPREARAALDDARDNLDVARKTRDAMSEKLKTAEADIKSANDRVAAAANAVVLEGLDLDALISQVTTLQRDLLRVGGTLTYLANRQIITDKNSLAQINRTDLDNRILEPVSRFYSPPATWNGVLHGDGVRGLDDYGARTWGAAIEALKNDANALLPGVI